MKDLISYSDFAKIEIRLGTIISAELNNKLRKPSYVLKINFGDEIGVKKSSAQLTRNYKVDQLLHKQIAAVINFPKKQIGDLISDVLVLGFPDDNNEPILFSPDKKLVDGGQIY
ncbi:MAG: tRNA-binding protein [Proteobacteria bacterium]|jgi:tRNA-binding protein|nr:tRNA-binding protein [Pelagibacterales bacterium]MBL6675279.1 tRNA-binding protein [Alphaproteobacteria bacterium]MDA1180804.1 tRNA-binding protein [Pseudomonadota bacterium]